MQDSTFQKDNLLSLALKANFNLIPRADFVLFRFDFTEQSEQQVQPGWKRCLIPWVRGWASFQAAKMADKHCHWKSFAQCANQFKGHCRSLILTSEIVNYWKVSINQSTFGDGQGKHGKNFQMDNSRYNTGNDSQYCSKISILL